MGYSKHVGRVGALAVALGVGGTVANGAPIAMAAPEPDAPGVESAAPGNVDPPKHPAVLKPHSIAETFSEVRQAFEGLAARPGSRIHTLPRPRGQVDGSVGSQSTDQPAPRTVAVQHSPSTKPPVSPRRTVVQHVESTVERTIGDVKGALERASRPPVSSAPVSSPSPVVERQSATNIVVADPPDTQARMLVEPSPVRSTIAATRPLPRLLSLFGFGSHPGGGVLPRENPLVAAILGFVRRLDRTFDNRTPTTDFNPQQVVQVDADRAVGYLDPVDPDSSRLTYEYTTAKNGTVTFDPTTPGEFTYAAPAGRDETVPWTDTVTITTSDAESGWHVHGLAGLFQPGGGHTTTQTVQIILKKVDDPTVGDDGTVTGHVPADNSTLSYASGGDLPGTVGTVELNDDGTWVFKPTAAAQDAAANGGPATVTFTIIAKDGEHQTPISLTAKIAPTSGPPAGAEPSGDPVTGTDGSSVQASTVDNKTYLTITDPNGVRHTSQPLPGLPVGTPVSAAGNGYQATYDGDKTYLNIVLPNGSVKSTEVQGQTDGTIVVGPGGEAYVKSVVAAPQMLSSRQGFARFAVTAMPVGSLADTGTDTHYITVLKPDGGTFEVELTGQESGALVLTDDGYAYQTTYQGQSGAYETYVTVINPEAETWATSDAIAGEPRQQIVTTNGTVFQLAYAPPADVDGVPGSDELTDVTTVNKVAHDGTLTTGVLHGDSSISNPVYAPDGTLFMTSYSHLTQEGQSSLVTIDEDGDFQTADLPGGLLFREVKFDSDGFAYVTTYQQGLDDNNVFYEHSFVTVIGPNGTIPDPSAAVAISGTPRSQGLFFGPNGAAYIVSSDGTAVTFSTIGQDGAVDELASLPGSSQDSALVAADGTVYISTFERAPDFSVTFYANVIEPDGTLHKIPIRGQEPDGKVVMDPQGVVYQPAYDNGTGMTYVTVVHGDGTYQETVGIPGRVFTPLVVGPDGTVYQTSYSFDTHQTYVSIIAPDGSVRRGDPLNGPSGTGVTFDADGRVYQPLASGTVELDPSTWAVYPTPDTFSTQIALPTGATPTAPLVIGADGTAFQRSYDQGTNTSYLTVVRADGSAFTSDPLPGGSINSPVATANGTLYQLSSDALGHKEYLNVVDSLGHTTSIELPGQLVNPVVVGPDNTVYQTSQESGGGSAVSTYVTVAGPDGANTTTAISGGLQGPIVVDGNGNAYLTTTDGAQSYVTVVNAAGELVAAPTPLPNEALGGVMLGSTGAAYQTTRAGNQTYVATIDPDGTVHPGIELTGEPSSFLVAGPDGTAIQTTFDFGTKTTYVSAIGTDGSIVYTKDFAGSTGSGPAVGADGTVYQMFYRETATPGEYDTYVVAIKPDGATPEVHVTTPITGLAHIAGIRFRDDGVAYLITSTEPPGDTQTYVTTFDAEGNVLESVELRGLPVNGTYLADADGSVYITTYKQVPSSADPQETYVNFVDAAGNVHEEIVHRAAYFDGPAGVDLDGTVYQLTFDSAANETYVTTVDSLGVVHESDAIQGYPGGQALVVAPDGTVYVTTLVNDGAAGRTYVTTVGPDGSVHTGEPFTGYPDRGVVVDSHGKVFQSTSTGVWVVQTSTAGGTSV